MTTSSFATLMHNKPDWALQVSSPRDFALMRTAQQRPTVAFAPLAFSQQAQDYIASLNIKQDVFANTRRTPGGLYKPFGVSGWHADPALSHKARALFEKQICTSLPNRPGRDEIAHTLSGAYADVASALDRKHLRFALTVLSDVPKWSIHEDAGQPYTAGIVLRDGGTFVLPSGSCPRSARQVHSDFDIDYRAEDCQLEQGRHMPERSLCLWTENVPHAVALGRNMTRVGVFAFVDHHNVTAARPATPTRLMRLQDRAVNYLKLP